MTRWKLTIEYEGTAYAGWQRQEHDPSVQQSIEEAIYGFCQQKVTLHAAGRTDAGVHACGQVAHCDLKSFSKPMAEFEVAKAINAHLRPAPICIIKAEIVDGDFHARFAAKNKLYHYRILNRPAPPALGRGRFWHYKRPLDPAVMERAAQYLTGHHDFTTFRASQCQAKTPMRTLDRLDLQMRDYDHCGGEELIIKAEARSFLHHQVRNIVGTLVLVGEGKWAPEDVKTVLEARDRTKGGQTAPAAGLYLVKVGY